MQNTILTKVVGISKVKYDEYKQNKFGEVDIRFIDFEHHFSTANQQKAVKWEALTHQNEIQGHWEVSMKWR